MPEPVIIDTVRTPIGRAFKGSLTHMRPDDMGAHVINALLERNPQVSPADVEEVSCGVGLPQGKQAFNLARVITLLSDLPETVNGITTSRYCASGLDAIRWAANSIRAGQGHTYIAAGVEAVSQYNERQEAAGEDDKHPDLKGEKEGDFDVYISMGLTAENVAERYGVGRREMDEYAQRSQEKAVESQENGFFEREIVPVPGADGSEVTKDDGPRPTSTVEKLAELEPAFKEDGVVTAGNSCPLNDGAAAVLVMSDERAKELELEPRARIITAATAGNEPEYMGVAPIWAIKKVLDRAGMTIGDVDIVELNEAFAAQVIPIMSECGIELDKLNPHGGAIALGHPFGQTGARIMGTLLNGLETDGGTIGLETMCVAGGQGEAVLVERLN